MSQEPKDNIQHTEQSLAEAIFPQIDLEDFPEDEELDRLVDEMNSRYPLPPQETEE